jgi:hypothetical protein
LWFTLAERLLPLRNAPSEPRSGGHTCDIEVRLYVDA